MTNNNSVEAKYFYVYYAALVDQYGWSIREENIDNYNMVIEGRDYQELICGALVENKHIAVLEALLNKMEDVTEWVTAIDIFSNFV